MDTKKSDDRDQQSEYSTGGTQTVESRPSSATVSSIERTRTTTETKSSRSEPYGSGKPHRRTIKARIVSD